MARIYAPTMKKIVKDINEYAMAGAREMVADIKGELFVADFQYSGKEGPVMMFFHVKNCLGDTPLINPTFKDMQTYINAVLKREANADKEEKG